MLCASLLPETSGSIVKEFERALRETDVAEELAKGGNLLVGLAGDIVDKGASLGREKKSQRLQENVVVLMIC